ncbi:olfactory receptor 52E8-like [Gastrophryne carolinensis]
MNDTLTTSDFVLLGLRELEELHYLYCVLFMVIYVIILFMSGTTVFIVLTEESLHEPMYVLIGNLVLNGIFETSSFYPKLISDLITSSKTIGRAQCLTQIYFISSFSLYELYIFAIMAYDRYLAVCHPFRYLALMTIEKVVKLNVGFLIFLLTAVLIAVLLSSRLPLCGNRIKSVFCDNMSFFVLSCVDSSVNNLYGMAATGIFLTLTLATIIYSYMQIFLICCTVSRDAHKKAVHTLMTHLINFSIFLTGILFVFVRHRLGNGDLPLSAHILLSISFVVFPPLLNPFIYGVRTKVLRDKIVQFLWKPVKRNRF